MTKTKVILVILALVATYAFGRYSAPTKTITEVKVVEVEKKTSDTEANRNKHKVTETTETTYPDGRKEVKTVVTEDSNTDKKSSTTSDSSKNSDSKTVVESRAGKITISALAGLTFPNTTPVYGGHLTADVIGPISTGVWALSSGASGISVGLSF